MRRNSPYCIPSTVAEAVILLAGFDGEARLLAGGQTLISELWWANAAQPPLIDLRKVESLRTISGADDWIAIGAMVTIAQAADDAGLATELPAFVQAMHSIASLPVRHRATIGGTLALAESHAELLTCLVALDGRVSLASPRGNRSLPAQDFLRGPRATACAADEMVTQLHLPRRRPKEAHGFAEITHRPSGGRARALAFARLLPLITGDSTLSLTVAGEIGPPRTHVLSSGCDLIRIPPHALSALLGLNDPSDIVQRLALAASTRALSNLAESLGAPP